jgi:hypothetical protein
MASSLAAKTKFSSFSAMGLREGSVLAVLKLYSISRTKELK